MRSQPAGTNLSLTVQPAASPFYLIRGENIVAAFTADHAVAVSALGAVSADFFEPVAAAGLIAIRFGVVVVVGRYLDRSSHNFLQRPRVWLVGPSPFYAPPPGVRLRGFDHSLVVQPLSSAYDL